MTVIVSYQTTEFVFLIGDLLISGVDRIDQILLPTRFVSVQPEAPPHLVGLCQKVVCVNDNLAIAWAGSKIVAQHLIARIANELCPPYSSEQILNLIYSSGLSENELSSVSFIFYGAHRDEKSGHIHQFVQDYLTGETIINDSSKIKYAGSGQYHFLECMDFKVVGTQGVITDFEQSLAWLIARMAMAIFHEIISDTNHYFSYGGGFEVACLNPSAKIAKVPITFIFWTIRGDGIELAGPILAFNYPTGRQLFISRLHREEGSGDWKLSQFIVNDILGQSSIGLSSFLPDFDTFFTVHYFVPQSAEGAVKLLVKKGYNKNIRITASPVGEKFEVEISEAFMGEIWDVIK